MPRDHSTPLVDEVHEQIAQRQAAVLVDYLTDAETVERITTAWSGSLDKMIGRGVRRLTLYALGVVFMVGVVKFDLLSGFLKKLLG